MPREIFIDGLVVDESHHPEDYPGLYLFSNPADGTSSAAARPFPCRLTEQVTIRHLTTASGLRPRSYALRGFVRFSLHFEKMI